MSQHDLQVARRSVLDAFKQRGQRVVFRHRWNDQDNEAGLVTKCSRCYDGAYQDAADTDCPVCFGSGYTGGYAPPFNSWADLDDITKEIDWKQGIGYFEPDTGNAKSYYDPPLRELDVVWIVDKWDKVNKEVLEVHDMFVIVGSVTTGYIKNNVTTMDDETIYWEWQFTKIPTNDIRRTLAWK